MDFLPVFSAIPLSLSGGSEFLVASLGIVGDGVEKVLEVVESYSGHLYAATIVGSADSRASQQAGNCCKEQRNSELSHEYEFRQYEPLQKYAFFLLQQKIVLELSAVTVSFKKKCYICPLKPSYREI